MAVVSATTQKFVPTLCFSLHARIRSQTRTYVSTLWRANLVLVPFSRPHARTIILHKPLAQVRRIVLLLAEDDIYKPLWEYNATTVVGYMEVWSSWNIISGVALYLVFTLFTRTEVYLVDVPRAHIPISLWYNTCQCHECESYCVVYAYVGYRFPYQVGR